MSSPPGRRAKGFAANGYGEHSPGHYSLLAGAVTEAVLTMMFLFVIMGATHGKAPAGFAPLAIGLALTLVHLVGIPVTNMSVNPACSTAPALFVGGWALGQLWLFWLAPIVGGIIGGVLYRFVSEEEQPEVTGVEQVRPPCLAAFEIPKQTVIPSQPSTTGMMVQLKSSSGFQAKASHAVAHIETVHATNETCQPIARRYDFPLYLMIRPSKLNILDPTDDYLFSLFCLIIGRLIRHSP